MDIISQLPEKASLNHLTARLSLPETVTLALWRLGGSEHPIDTEDIAVKASELAPGVFAWRKYPDQINLELIRVNLSDAKLKAGLVTGSGREGWSLTTRGVAWAKEREHITTGDVQRTRAERRSGSIDEVRWRRERDRILTSSAWERWVTDRGTVTSRQAGDVFRIDAYAVGRIRDLKVNRLLNLFENDDEVKPFLEQMAAIVATQGVDG